MFLVLRHATAHFPLRLRRVHFSAERFLDEKGMNIKKHLDIELIPPSESHEEKTKRRMKNEYRFRNENP